MNDLVHIPHTELDIFAEEPIEIFSEDGDQLRKEIDDLLGSISGHEMKLATSYARLGGRLLKVRAEKRWAEWGYASFGQYIDDIRARIGRQRAQIYAMVSVSERLLPSVSESDLEEMGISKAQELARYTKQSGLRVPQDLLNKALDPQVGISELHVAVLEALHEKHDPRGTWFSFGGAYLLPEEKDAYLQAFDLAKRVEPLIPHDMPEHMQVKEVMLRFAQSFYAEYINEVNGQ